MKYILIAFAYIGLVLNPMENSDTRTVSGQMNTFSAIQNQIAAGIESYDMPQLIQASKELDRFIDDPEWRTPSLYYKAYINYRLSTLFEDEIDQEQDALIKQAVDWLQQALKQAEGEYKADSYALLSSCYGILIGGPFSAMSYGPKAQEAMEKAKRFGEDNPRVYLLDGIGKMYTPSMFGGGYERAKKQFLRSRQLFEKEQSNPPLISWGKAEIHIWLGRLYEQDDQLQQAKNAYEQALAVNPDFNWVKEKLLPDIREKLQSD
jgi:tetratricopeptide (TPR) repeat protein